MTDQVFDWASAGVISIFREPLVVRHCLIRLDQTPRHPDLGTVNSIWGLQSLIPRNYLEQIGFSSNDWLSKSDRSSIHHRVSSLPRIAQLDTHSHSWDWDHM